MSAYMNTHRLSVRLALRDWLHEFKLSLCGVLALASIITPLLILQGVHLGIIGELKNRLMQDPTVLVVVPAGSTARGYDEAFIREIAALPDVKFCTPRTRDIAAELQLAFGSARLAATLEPTGPGDPLLKKGAAAAPTAADKSSLQIVLSQTAARKLGAKAGDLLETRLMRRSKAGRLETLSLRLHVTGVLPVTATGMDAVFAPMPFLLAVQDYRDDITTALLEAEGSFPAPEKRFYESFRAYANSLEGVERLDAWFSERDVPVRTKAKAIADLRRMDEAFGAVVGIISLAACFGFAAFMFSSVYASVERKEKTLGMLRLLGFDRASLLAMPIVQSLTTGFLGSLLAFAAYGAIALAIDAVFAPSTGGIEICRIPPLEFPAALAAVELLTFLAVLRPALLAARVEPARVIRSA